MKALFLLLVLSPFALAEEGIPSRAKRMKALEEAGLIQLAQTMDELDQDLLYMRAKNRTRGELEKIYPAIDPLRLQALISVLQ